MNRVIASLIVLIFGVSFGSNCSGQSELTTKSRPAGAAEVLGTWQLSYQIIRPGMPDSLFFSDFQRFQFHQSGHVRNIASSVPLTQNHADELFAGMPKRATYAFQRDGFLVVERSENDLDMIVISLITSDLARPLRENAPRLSAGMLILSYLDPDRRVYMQRYLQRVPNSR